MKTKLVFKILALTMIVPWIFFQAGTLGEIKDGHSVSAKKNLPQDAVISEPLVMKVILERAYLDGEISQETVEETIWSMEDFWAKYDQWQLIDMDLDHLVFRQQIDDISPLLKANGYFGITEEGILTIFNGIPQKEHIIQSFFQIDLGKLESTKCEELRKGIPIKTKDQYVEVLETFKTYSKEAKQAE